MERLEMQQMRIHPEGRYATGNLPAVQREVRISECDLLHPGMRFYRVGSALEIITK